MEEEVGWKKMNLINVGVLCPDGSLLLLHVASREILAILLRGEQR